MDNSRKHAVLDDVQVMRVALLEVLVEHRANHQDAAARESRATGLSHRAVETREQFWQNVSRNHRGVTVELATRQPGC